MPVEHVPVALVGDHPHAGCTGYLVVTDGNVSTTDHGLGGVQMVRVTLTNCRHGTEACYASAGQLQQLVAVPIPTRRRARRA